MRLAGITILTAAVLVAAAGFVSAAERDVTNSPVPRLSVPVDCQIGATCFLQSHVDLIAGEGAGDFACGLATYDGHKGTDFRVLSNAATTGEGVPVLAAAAGTVRGVRDGMADILLRDAGARKGQLPPSLRGRECGNGLVLDHGGGWETQYCHLKQGSVLVRKGQPIRAGERLGSVGYSGKADFAHLHFEVRKDGQTVDPFVGPAAVGQNHEAARCDGHARRSGTPMQSTLWDDEAAGQMVYRTGVILSAGFSGRTLDSADLERDHVVELPNPDSKALIFLVRAMNLEKGDRIRLRVTGPDGFSVRSEGDRVDRAKAIWMAYAGKRLKGVRWAPGTYTGEGDIVRDNRVVSSRRVVFQLR